MQIENQRLLKQLQSEGILWYLKLQVEIHMRLSEWWVFY
ncbi:MAG: hypothetical protein ACI815_001209 [Psychroserpens sp.]|jgi:hypothetical protein